MDGRAFVEESAEGEEGPEGVWEGAPVAAGGGDLLGVDEGEGELFAPVGGRRGGGEVALKGEEGLGVLAILGEGGGQVGEGGGGCGLGHSGLQGREVAAVEGEGARGVGQGVAIEEALGHIVGGGTLGFEPLLGAFDGLVSLLGDGEGQGGLGLNAQGEVLSGEGKGEEGKEEGQYTAH